AQKIVDYRKGYKFKSINEVKNVNGIGEKRFEKIKKDLSV
ncbi:MAG: competence protein, partial [Epsilonproteobacteria bacterium]